MDGNFEFLNYVYQKVDMGKYTMNQLIVISEDEEYKTIYERVFPLN